MIDNPDEALLVGRTIDPAHPVPVGAQALRIGLYDEYRARAFYRLVMERFGPRRPFVNIAAAEDRHIAAMTELCRRYGVDPPIDDWRAKLPVPQDLASCCAIGVAGETANGAMYDRFLRFGWPPDVSRVFAALRGASWGSHLPAFQQCDAGRPLVSTFCRSAALFVAAGVAATLVLAVSVGEKPYENRRD